MRERHDVVWRPSTIEIPDGTILRFERTALTLLGTRPTPRWPRLPWVDVYITPVRELQVTGKYDMSSNLQYNGEGLILGIVT